MAKVVPIIEYQEKIQWTPEEALKCIEKEIKTVRSMIIVYISEDNHLSWMGADENRNFSRADMLWMMEQWKTHFLAEV